MGKMLIVMGTVITGLVAACVSLTASVHALQAEVSKLETRQTAADGARRRRSKNWRKTY